MFMNFFGGLKPLSVVTLTQLKHHLFKLYSAQPRLTRNAVHISVSGRVEVPVEFADTGHPFLDSRPVKHPKDLHVSDLFSETANPQSCWGLA